ncbi:MAG: alpha/beta hydrolase fold domain-containing protein [Woeseiaceae bacterium]|nr:alpha/beta hydrolase fold domain-containing protein [Woeseiaceae bacterium]
MGKTGVVEVDPGPDPDGSVIWLHGLGADGHDFEPIVPDLDLGDEVRLRYVFPHAPVRPVTINGGTSMRAWYDILTLERGGPQDEEGIRASGDILEGLIKQEYERGIPCKKIVVAGFSQGGAIALHTATRFSEPLGGLMALSTYVPLRDTLDAEVLNNAQSQSRDMKIFMAHGSFDPVVPVGLGESSRDLLQDSGFSVEWRDYPMAHAVCTEEITHIRNWLGSIYRSS